MILKILLSEMRLFQLDQEDNKRKFDAQASAHRKRGIGGIRDEYIRFDSVSPAHPAPNNHPSS